MMAKKRGEMNGGRPRSLPGLVFFFSSNPGHGVKPGLSI
jgi:hypothetical protein